MTLHGSPHRSACPHRPASPGRPDRPRRVDPCPSRPQAASRVPGPGSGAGVFRLLLLLLPLLPVVSVVSPRALAAQAGGGDAPRTPARVLEEAPDDAWRSLAPERTVYMTLETGARVILELAPEFAPRHVDNIRAMIRAGLFDGGAVVRSQDNYVVQWAARPGAVQPGAVQGGAAPAGIATELAGEFSFAPDVLPFTPLPDGDVYAPEVGFMNGFPVGRDPAEGRAWVLHCYGVVGVARGETPTSGNGAGLYAVNGHAPRHLDRNLTMPGRVVAGMEHLSALPRGTGPLGFYETTGEEVEIVSARLGTDVPPRERTSLQVMRTEAPAFLDWMEARRRRVGPWWIHTAGAVGICNVGVPTRDPATSPAD